METSPPASKARDGLDRSKPPNHLRFGASSFSPLHIRGGTYASPLGGSGGRVPASERATGLSSFHNSVAQAVSAFDLPEHVTTQM